MKKVVVLVSLVLVLSLVVGTVSAAGRASALIVSYSTDLSIVDTNKLQVYADIVASKNVSSLGVTYIEIQKKVSGTWRVVETYDYISHPELRTSNAVTHLFTVDCGNILSGYDYRAHVVFFASEGLKSDSRDVYTNVVRK